MTITVPDNFKGIFHCDQKFAVKPLEIVGNFISQDIKQPWASQHSSMLLERNGMISLRNYVPVKRYDFLKLGLLNF